MKHVFFKNTYFLVLLLLCLWIIYEAYCEFVIKNTYFIFSSCFYYVNFTAFPSVWIGHVHV